MSRLSPRIRAVVSEEDAISLRIACRDLGVSRQVLLLAALADFMSRPRDAQMRRLSRHFDDAALARELRRNPLACENSSVDAGDDCPSYGNEHESENELGDNESD